MADLMINGVDASVYGISMGDGFIDSLQTPSPLKDFIENISRLDDGKQVMYHNPRLTDRDLTLNFVIIGTDSNDFQTKKKAFENLLYSGKVVITVSFLNESFRLTYQRFQSFAQNSARTSCKMAVKFNEPDPSNRSL